MTDQEHLEKIYMDGLLAAYESPERVEFPTHEDDYDEAHFAIHTVLEAVIPGFKVGDGTDIMVAGRSPYAYCSLYEKIYNDSQLGAHLLMVSNTGDIASAVSTIVTMKFYDCVSAGYDKLLVARVLHDAIHHLILRHRGERLSQFAQLMRYRMFSAYYQFKAMDGSGNTMINLPSIGDVDASHSHKDMDTVAAQIELDAGLKKEIIISFAGH